jgi:hypothetical protein
MFAEGFFSITVGEVLGIVVAIFGIYYVVRQLNEARLASQMEGMIALATMGNEMQHDKDVISLREFIALDEWTKLSGQEAFEVISNEKKYKRGYDKQVSVYELVGGLVKAGALDIRVADNAFGYYLPFFWNRLEKYTKTLQNEYGATINEHWEWAAKEFEKLNN